MKKKINFKNVLKAFCFMLIGALIVGVPVAYSSYSLTAANVTYGSSTVKAKLDDLFTNYSKTSLSDNRFGFEYFLSNVSSTISEKKKNGNITTTTKTNFKEFTNLSGYTGTYNTYKDASADTDSTVDTYWYIPVNYSKFTSASRIEISLLNYDNTTTKLDAAGYSDFYTKLCMNSSSTCSYIIPLITIYKATNSTKIHYTVSNCDFDNTQFKISCSDGSCTDNSIYWSAGFYSSYTNGKLQLEYSSYKKTDKDYYTGCTTFDISTDAKADKMYASKAYDAASYILENAAGTKAYACKNTKDNSTETYSGYATMLRARYNYWAISVSYY